MRALWSRAARSPGSSPARLGITAGGRLVSPRWSSSLSAAAATAAPWDAAYARLHEARARPLSAAEKSRASEGAAEVEVAAAAPAIADHIPLEALPTDLDWDAVARAVGMDVVDDASLERKMHSRAYDDPNPDDAWDDLRFDSSLPGMQALRWPANTGRTVTPYNLPPQSLWAPDSLRLVAMRRRYTWKKMATLEFATALLIHSLLRASRAHTYRHSLDLAPLSPEIAQLVALSPADAADARSQIRASLDQLHLTPVDSPEDDIARARRHPPQPAIPCYTQDADGDFHNVAQQLNSGLRKLLHHPSREGISSRQAAAAVTKICHNLLVSSASPNLHTFNILLTGFKRWRRPDLVDTAIAAFYASKIRPNEIACREILGHYITVSRPAKFSHFVALMRGVDDALMLANPATNVNDAGQGRLIRVSENKVYQKVHPTPMVFGALIGGVLKFAGFDRALDVYYEMKGDGWGLDIPSLTRLLGDCIRRRDWQGGAYVWQEINSIKTMAMPREMAKAYEFMLSLCSVTDQTGAFNHLLGEVVKSGFDRRSILDAALNTTRWARKKRASTAPAWAADNVMIAVSGFIGDSKREEREDAIFTQSSPGENASEWMEPDHYLEAEEQHRANTDKEAWASWVEAEFGERPKDPEP